MTPRDRRGSLDAHHAAFVQTRFRTWTSPCPTTSTAASSAGRRIQKLRVFRGATSAIASK